MDDQLSWEHMMYNQEAGRRSRYVAVLLIAHLRWRVGLRSILARLKPRSPETPSAF